MRIECPSCMFSAEMKLDGVPAGRLKVKCPKCKERFELSHPGEEPPAIEPPTPQSSAPVGFDDEPLMPQSSAPMNLDDEPDTFVPPELSTPSMDSEVDTGPGPIGLDTGVPDLSGEGFSDLPDFSNSGFASGDADTDGPAGSTETGPDEPDPFQESLSLQETLTSDAAPGLPPAIEVEGNSPYGEGMLDPSELTHSSGDDGGRGRIEGLELTSDFAEQAASMDAGPNGLEMEPALTPFSAEEEQGLKLAEPAGPSPTGFARRVSGGGGLEGRRPSHAMKFKGSARTLLGIYVVNMLLTVVTLGFYYCWAKIKIRKYLYGATELMSERFTFTGTGRELFAGRVRATGILIVLFGGPQVLAEMVHPALALLVIPAILFLAPVARVSAMRYRFCRTLWRNVQFSFRGRVKEALKLYATGTLLTIVTLGFYYPFFYVDKQQFFRTNTQFGTEPFGYDGHGKELFGTFFAGAILMPLTLGLYWFWLKARLTRYNWEHTTFQGLTFSSTVTGLKLFGLKLGNALIVVFTLGLGYPWVVVRNMEFNFRHLKIAGSADLSSILKTDQDAKAVGEGLLDQLDMDFAI